MTFTEFAQMLYPYIGRENSVKSKSDYVVFLINLIIEEPLDGDRDQYNPLASKGPSLLEKIYRGSAQIKPEYAGTILAHSDKELFKSYLLTLSIDAIMSMGKAMREKGIIVSNDDETTIATVCSNLFMSVLEGRAREQKAIKKKGALPPPHNTTPQNNTPCEEMVINFKKTADHYHIEDFMNRDPAFIDFKNLCMDYDLLSLATRFVEAIQSDIIPFGPYKSEMTYINISRFIILMSNYKEYLKHNLHQNRFSNISVKDISFQNPILDELQLKSNSKSEFEKETDRYRHELKSLYNKICNNDTN